MDIAYDILRMHVQCRTPGLMESGIHVSAVQTELPHKCVGIVIEQKRHVVMNPTIAAYLPAPNVAHICLVDAMSQLHALVLSMLDLCPQRGKELRDELVAVDCGRIRVRWNVQIHAHQASALVAMEGALKACMHPLEVIADQRAAIGEDLMALK